MQEEGGPNLAALRVLPRDAMLITDLLTVMLFWRGSFRRSCLQCRALSAPGEDGNRHMFCWMWSQVVVPTALKHAISWQLTSFMRDQT